MIIHHDRDPVFTGYGWTAQLLQDVGVRLSYTLNGAKDNPQMEAFISRFKAENRSLLLDARSLTELAQVVDQRMWYHNGERRHSSIGYLSPLAYIELMCPRFGGQYNPLPPPTGLTGFRFLPSTIRTYGNG